VPKKQTRNVHRGTFVSRCLMSLVASGEWQSTAQRVSRWYEEAVIYELHVRAFHDSDGNGAGDFSGLIEKLHISRKSVSMPYGCGPSAHHHGETTAMTYRITSEFILLMDASRTSNVFWRSVSVAICA
jgi:hypothetical protein